MAVATYQSVRSTRPCCRDRAWHITQVPWPWDTRPRHITIRRRLRMPSRCPACRRSSLRANSILVQRLANACLQGPRPLTNRRRVCHCPILLRRSLLMVRLLEAPFPTSSWLIDTEDYVSQSARRSRKTLLDTRRVSLDKLVGNLPFPLALRLILRFTRSITPFPFRRLDQWLTVSCSQEMLSGSAICLLKPT